MLKLFRDDLLVQFSVVSFVIMVSLAIGIGVLLHWRLDDNITLLREHGAAMMAGAMIKESDPFSIPSLTENVHTLKSLAIGTIGGTFVVLYMGLVLIVLRGWRTITAQRQRLVANVQSLKASQDQLVQSAKLATVGELTSGIAHELGNPLAGILGITQSIVD